MTIHELNFPNGVRFDTLKQQSGLNIFQIAVLAAINSDDWYFQILKPGIYDVTPRWLACENLSCEVKSLIDGTGEFKITDLKTQTLEQHHPLDKDNANRPISGNKLDFQGRYLFNLLLWSSDEIPNPIVNNIKKIKRDKKNT